LLRGREHRPYLGNNLSPGAIVSHLMLSRGSRPVWLMLLRPTRPWTDYTRFAFWWQGNKQLPNHLVGITGIELHFSGNGACGNLVDTNVPHAPFFKTPAS